jgi:hypothetical protein
LEEKVKLEVKRIGEKERCDMVALGELCEIKYGTRITKKDAIKEKDKKNGIIGYPVYGGGDITFYTKLEPNRTGKTVIISRFGISKTCVRLLNDDVFLNDSGMSLHIFDNINKELYIGMYLLNNSLYVYNCANASAQKNIDMDLFKQLKIPIPRDTVLIDNLETDFKQIETLQKEIKDNESEYKRVLQELADDIKPTTKLDSKDTESDNNNQSCIGSDTESIDVSDKERTRKKKKKKSRKTKDITDDKERSRKKKKKKSRKTEDITDDKEISHKKKHKNVKNIMESSEEEPDIRVVSKKNRKVKVIKRKN